MLSVVLISSATRRPNGEESLERPEAVALAAADDALPLLAKGLHRGSFIANRTVVVEAVDFDLGFVGYAV